MLHLNPHYQTLPGAYLFAEVARKVQDFARRNPGEKLIHLGIGDVTQPLPQAAVTAMTAAVQEMASPETFRGYGPACGYDFLIDAVRQGHYAPLGVSLAREEVFISDGAKSDTGSLQELFSADTVVAVTDPVYPVYVEANAMAGRAGSFVQGRWSRIVYLPCCAANDFVPPLPEKKVDVVYLCSPNNPTGTAMSQTQLQAFVDWARANGALLIFDAAYSAYITDSALPRSIYQVEGAQEVAIECGSFSKSAGFTGVRCGYTVVPQAVCGLGLKNQRVRLNDLWRRRMAARSNGVSYPVQRGAAAVLAPDGQAQVRAMVAHYMENARHIREGLRAGGFTVYGGVNAPYIWLKTPGGMDSWQFFDRLLEECRIVGTPGAGFGPGGEGYFRLTAFNTREQTMLAMERLGSWRPVRSW